MWLGVSIDEIFTSPLVRARQTADLLAARLPEHPPVKPVDELAPGHEIAQVIAELGKRVKRRRVAIVGHEPDLGELAAALLGAQRALPFRKGGVCRIDVDGLGSTRAGTLIWFLPPKILRKAATVRRIVTPSLQSPAEWCGIDRRVCTHERSSTLVKRGDSRSPRRAEPAGGM